ncbi:MAG TPA: CPBP family intramembrane glutamic endopeptidase [Lysobacter sp.]
MTLGQPPPPAPRASVGRAVGGFFLDLAIAVAVLFAVSMLCGLAWAITQGVRVATTTVRQGGELDPSVVMAQLGQPGGVALLLMTLAGTSSAALVVYAWRRRADASERVASLQAAKRPATWAWALLAGTTTFVLGIFFSLLGRAAGIELEPTNLALIEGVRREHPLLLLVFAVVLAPAYEELLFRRVLFGRLLAAGRPWLGLVLSSAAFALLHELPGTSDQGWSATLLLWLTYGGMGAAFAWVYWRTGTLWAAIAAHAGNNLVACALLFAGIQ